MIFDYLVSERKLGFFVQALFMSSSIVEVKNIHILLI